MKRTLFETTLKVPYENRTNNEGPFYDPQDIHVHRFTYGPLKNKQNKKEIEIQSTGKPENYVKYCTLCHEVEYNTELSTTKNTDTTYINNFVKNIKKRPVEYGSSYMGKNKNVIKDVIKECNTILLEPRRGLYLQKETYKNIIKL